jgi:hypothetical protein
MSMTNRVEIWRYNDRTLTVAHSDGHRWNHPDWLSNKLCDGFWDSSCVSFRPRLPVISDHFTDGTPVALYEGLQPEAIEQQQWLLKQE